MGRVKIGIVGVGGYAAAHTYAADVLEEEGLAVTRSVVIRNRAKHPEKVKEYEERGVPVRSSFEEMLECDVADLDLITIPCGPNHRTDMVIPALDAGRPVVFEKPPAGAIQDMDAMIEATERNGLWSQVAFKSQSRVMVRKLKRLICDGKLGRIRSVAVRAMKSTSGARWRSWYGQLKAGDTWVLDGDMNNPYAHDLMNALYFASTDWQAIARPVTVRAELYKGWDIPSEDTSCVEIACDNGAMAYFFATLCPEEKRQPELEVVGEKGKATYRTDGDVQITYDNGTSETIPDAGDNYTVGCFRNAVRYLRGEETELDCPIQMVRPYVVAVNGAFESSGGTHKITDSMLKVTRDEERDATVRVIRGIDTLIARCFEERKLYSDMGAPWGVRTEPFNVEHYTHFDMAVC